MRPVATLVISVAMALGAIGLAVAAPGGIVGSDPELASAEVRAASGAVNIANSRAGHALFSAVAMRPGEGVSGKVTIGNDGDHPGRFSVRRAAIDDDEGPNGGKLSERVELVLFDITNLQNPVPKYAGPPAGFVAVDLGVIAPGQEREYLFAATLPDGGVNGDDNLFQGSSLSLGFEWTAVNTGDTPTPKPPTTTPPIADPTPDPGTPTTPTPTTPPPVALADALGLPSAKSCVKRGKLTLRLKAPAGAKVVSGTVKVNGKTKAKLKGAKAKRPVTLKKLKGTTKLSISIKASNKRMYSAARTYKACKR